MDANENSIEDRLCLRIIDPVTGVCLVQRESFPGYEDNEPFPVSLHLPVGEYLLHIEGRPFFHSQHGAVLLERASGDAWMDVTVRTGAPLELLVELSAPAWLELTVAGQVLRVDREAIGDQHGEENLQGELVSDSAIQAEVKLWRSAGYPLEVLFSREVAVDSSFAMTHVSSSLELGTTAKSEALAPGSYRLEVTLPGGRKLTRKVLLIAGETLTVSMDFGDR